MDQPRAPQLEVVGISFKRKRSQISRRPLPEAQSLPEQSPVPSTSVSNGVCKVSSDENYGDGNSSGKMFNLNQYVSNAVLGNGICDGHGKIKKLKLKVGGSTCTIQAKPDANGASGSVLSAKANRSTDNTRQQQRLTGQESPEDGHSPTSDKQRGLQGIPWKNFSKDNFVIGNGVGRASRKNAIVKQVDNLDSVRKSKRAPKRRVRDADFDDDDDEIRYLEKLKSTKIAGYGELEPIKKLLEGGTYGYEKEEEPSSDGDPEGKKKTKLKMDQSELGMENKREMALTTRQRALLTKDASASGIASQIEFPNGLPPAPPRKQKEKLSEVEQQLKKAQAAQRRRMQNEKTARESEAEAIRKILGQDSSRKKREEKMKKRQEELTQEKAAHAQMLASNTIRTVMGPTGTTVTFPQEMGFPKIFDSKPCSYPPPREQCAGPFCNNDYKYRDSRLKLPLCSLQCYKAINEKINGERAC